MEFDKEKFYRTIDKNDHLNTRTKEAYRNYFLIECEGSMQSLYINGSAIFPESEGLHQYVMHSIEQSEDYSLSDKQEAVTGNAIERQKETGDEKITGINSERKKQSATTWGTNNDVKHK